MRAAEAIIHVDAITRNLARVRERAGACKVMAVVKADGYGHGLERVVRQLAGADAFGVASIDDAERIRALGMSQRIVLLSGFDEPRDLAIVRELRLDCVLHDPEQLAILRAEARAASLGPIAFWLKFDSGMHRLGFPIAQAQAVLAAVHALPQQQGELVVMSHFANADTSNAELSTLAQREQLYALQSAFPQPLSFCNSAATLGLPTMRHQWIRPGGILYGLSTVQGRSGADLGFEPAMQFQTRLIACKPIPAGAAVGYGGSFVAPKAMRLGIAAIGYGDGYPRHTASGTPVLLHDGTRWRQSSVVGRVSMDLLALDLTELPHIDVGARVMLWGSELPVETIAEAAGTISYELTCGLTRRVRFVEARAQ
jgi:alanine racemase